MLDKENIIKLYTDGNSITYIKSIYNCNPNTIKRILDNGYLFFPIIIRICFTNNLFFLICSLIHDIVVNSCK